MKIINGLFIYAVFSMAVFAQTKTGVANQDDIDAQIIAEVNKSVVGRLLNNNIQAQEKEKWNLESVLYLPLRYVLPKDGLNSVFLRLKDQKDELEITITEFASIEGARFPLTIHISQGVIKEYKNYGDEGRKIFSVSYGFGSLGFRKGKYYVSVSCCCREEIAGRFAGYADSAIENH